MTKKDFNEQLSHHIYGNGKTKRNALYINYKVGCGFRYMVKAKVEDLPLKDLKNTLYDWVTKEIQPPWYVDYRYAETDEKRFKVSLMG